MTSHLVDEITRFQCAVKNPLATGSPHPATIGAAAERTSSRAGVAPAGVRQPFTAHYFDSYCLEFSRPRFMTRVFKIPQTAPRGPGDEPKDWAENQ
jgi:hypothetical protein